MERIFVKLVEQYFNGIIMRQIFTLFILLGFAFQSNAQQNFNFLVKDTTAVYPADTSGVIIVTDNLYMLNSGTDTVLVDWAFERDHPTEWTMAVCTEEVCVGPKFVENPLDPVPIPPGYSYNWKLQMTHGNAAGIGTASIFIFNPDDATQADTVNLTIIMDDGTITSIEDKEENAFEIYPNPVKNVLQLNGDFQNDFYQYSIYNIIGNKVKEGILSPSIHTGDLEVGTYIFQITNNKGIVHQEHLIKN